MIDLYSGELADMLPSQMSTEIEQQCLSYALQQGIRIVIERAQMTRTQAMIDELPEKILDVLAVELRTPYYRESMDLETKRKIIKRTVLWHLTAGTPSAVRELISIIFGEGDIVEWFNYDEPPYTPGTFDIVTNAQMTENITEQFLAIIERVKNERSHIRRILINRHIDQHQYVGSGASTVPEDSILNNSKSLDRIHLSEGASFTALESPEESVLNFHVGNIATGKKDSCICIAEMLPYAIVTNNAEARSENTYIGNRWGITGVSFPGGTIINSTGANEDSIMSIPHRAYAAVFVSGTETTVFNGAMRSDASIAGMAKMAAGASADSTILI